MTTSEQEIAEIREPRVSDEEIAHFRRRNPKEKHRDYFADFADDLFEAKAQIAAKNDEIAQLKNSYRCYSYKQVFKEDHGHGLAAEHFGSWLKGGRPKCEDCLHGTATWGGGPHDPFYRVRKEAYDNLVNEIAAKDAQIAELKAALTEIARLTDSMYYSTTFEFIKKILAAHGIEVSK